MLLTAAQRATIVAAISAYDFGSNSTAAKNRDDLVAAIQSDNGLAYGEIIVKYLGTSDLPFVRCP